jgi:hypothetical protein
MKSALGWLAALAVLTAIALFFCVNTDESELGHRTAFYQSLVKNGDLNIINQVPPAGQWLVTRTHNHPTHVGNGIVTLWYPFYEYVRLLLPEGGPKSGMDEKLIFGLSGYQASAVLRNIFFLLLSWVLMRRFGSRQWPGEAEWLLPRLMLATPIPWYVFFEPFRVEITALALATALSLGVLDSLVRPPTPRRLFLLGLGIGWAYTVVSAFGIYAAPVLGWLLLRRSGALPRLAAGFGLGLAIPIGLNCVNSLLHAGTLWPASYPEVLSLVRGEGSHVISLLFGPYSVLLSSPVYLFLFLASIALPVLAFSPRAGRRWGLPASQGDVWLLWLLPVLFLAVWVLLHRRMASIVDEIPSRNMTYVFPILAGAFASFAEPIDNRRSGILLAALLLACTILNWTSIGQYVMQGAVSHFVPQAGVMSAFGGRLTATLARNWSQARELWRLVYFVPLMALLAAALAFVDRAAKEENWAALAKAGGALAAILVAGHAIVTGLNLLNNRANVEEMTRAGFFKASVVSEGPELDLYDEVLSILENGVAYLPSERVAEVIRVRSAYLQKAMLEVGADPIGFRKAWLEGCVRPSVWSTGSIRCDPLSVTK